MNQAEYYRKRWAWLVLLACLLAGSGARAGVLPLMGRLADAAGHMERLVDPQGRLDAAGAAQAAGWAALPGSLGEGFTPATIWLRLRLQVDEMAPGGWMLQLSNALLDDVRVYMGRDETWTLLGHSGEDVRRSRWPVEYRSPVILFEPPGPGVYTVMLRLQSKNALATRLDVWQRLAFDNRSRREGLLFGLYFGFYLLLIGLHALFWRATRAPMSGLFLAYIGNCVMNEVLSLGLVQQLTGLPVAWSDRWLGVGIAVSLPIALRMALKQLEVARSRAARGLQAASWLAAAVCAALVLLGRYGQGMAPIQTLALLCIVGLTGSALYLLRRGWRPARFFLLVFGVFYLGVLLAFLRNLGVLPVNPYTEYVSTLATMVHMLLLSLFIIGRHERRRRARERGQAHLAADLARQHSQRLEQEVALRTVAMQGEIQRRVTLEGELRAALAMERRVFDAQRDFVAMVSHEFRTPLAIITTSAQQLARNLGAPLEKSLARCGNIRDAAMRLLALVDEYLTDDRMREPRAELRLSLCDPRALLAELTGEFAPGRIRLDGGASARVCDAGLLRIALRNLLANADRHCPAEAVIRVRLVDGEAGLHIDIAHPGKPIAEADQGRLFQKYYRGQNAQARPGAGLGLYLVRSIAERLGGAVVLVSAGGDAPICFRLSLPGATLAA